MKRVIMPAQVTSLEDTILGRINLTQLLLLTVPLLIGSLIYVVVPPFYSATAPKLISISLIAVVCLVGAIRIRSRLVVQWVAVLGQFSRRPRYYVVRRAESFGRSTLAKLSVETALKDDQAVAARHHLPTTREASLNQPVSQTMTTFKLTKKGKLYAVIPKANS